MSSPFLVLRRNVKFHSLYGSSCYHYHRGLSSSSSSLSQQQQQQQQLRQLVPSVSAHFYIRHPTTTYANHDVTSVLSRRYFSAARKPKVVVPPTVEPTVAASEQTVAAASTVTDALPSSSLSSSSSSSTTTAALATVVPLPPHVERGPLYHKLTAWYQQQHQVQLLPETMMTTSCFFVPPTATTPTHYYIVTLSCPVTHWKFTSGTLRSDGSSTGSSAAVATSVTQVVADQGLAATATTTTKKKKRKTKNANPPDANLDTLPAANTATNNNDAMVVVAYPTMELALEAVCASALDVLRFRQTGLVEPRRCLEHPKEVISVLESTMPTTTTTTTTTEAVTTTTATTKATRTAKAKAKTVKAATTAATAKATTTAEAITKANEPIEPLPAVSAKTTPPSTTTTAAKKTTKRKTKTTTAAKQKAPEQPVEQHDPAQQDPSIAVLPSISPSPPPAAQFKDQDEELVLKSSSSVMASQVHMPPTEFQPQHHAPNASQLFAELDNVATSPDLSPAVVTSVSQQEPPIAAAQVVGDAIAPTLPHSASKVVVDDDGQTFYVVNSSSSGIPSLFATQRPKFQRQKSKSPRVPRMYLPEEPQDNELITAVKRMTESLPTTTRAATVSVPPAFIDKSPRPTQGRVNKKDAVVVKKAKTQRLSKGARRTKTQKKSSSSPTLSANAKESSLQPNYDEDIVLKPPSSGTLSLFGQVASSPPVEAQPSEEVDNADFAIKPGASSTSQVAHISFQQHSKAHLPKNIKPRQQQQQQQEEGGFIIKPSAGTSSFRSKIAQTDFQQLPAVDLLPQGYEGFVVKAPSSGISSIFSNVAPTEFQTPLESQAPKKDAVLEPPREQHDDDGFFIKPSANSSSFFSKFAQSDLPQPPTADALPQVHAEFVVKSPSTDISSLFSKKVHTEQQTASQVSKDAEQADDGFMIKSSSIFSRIAQKQLVSQTDIQQQNKIEGDIVEPSSGVSSSQLAPTELQQLQQPDQQSIERPPQLNGIGMMSVVDLSSMSPQVKSQWLYGEKILLQEQERTSSDEQAITPPMPTLVPMGTVTEDGLVSQTSIRQQNNTKGDIVEPSSGVSSSQLAPTELQQLQQPDQRSIESPPQLNGIGMMPVIDWSSMSPQVKSQWLQGEISLQEQKRTSSDEQAITPPMPTLVPMGTVTADGEDTEELVVQLKRSRISTLGHIMEAWVDDTNVSSEPDGQSIESLRLPLDEQPISPEHVVSRIKTWFRNFPPDPKPHHPFNKIRKRHQPSRYGKERGDESESPVIFTTAPMSSRISFTSTAANRAMNALASASRDHSLKGQTLGFTSQLVRRVEEAFSSGETDIVSQKEQIATQLLERMWAFAASSEEQPSAETYNAYLKCIHGPSTHGAARRASEILTRMQTSEPDESGRVLPLPNVGTLNAVLQLWARVKDETTRREGMQDVYERLVQNGNGGNTIVPNRETFVTILSSEAEDGLDTVFAKSWIDRMADISHDNPSLLPDSEVWNAPLRWSGVKDELAAGSRSPASWDDYSSIFQSGFRPVSNGEDFHSEQAQKAEAWLEQMKDANPALPNIETYESLIQALVRTGTRNGLKKAEAWAEQVIASSSQLKPRLSTFHPIIAAWAYCGDDEGPEWVTGWIKRLESLGDRSLPDGRVKGAYVQALVSVQQTKLKSIQTVGDEQSERTSLADEVQQAARKCSTYLESLCAEINQGKRDFILDATVFQQAILAWKTSIQAYDRAGGNDLERIDQAAEGLVHIVNQFDSLIYSLQLLPNEGNKSLSSSSDQQRRHLMLTAIGVLDAYLHSLIVIDRFRQRLPRWDKKEILLQRQLSQIEKLIRRCDELRQIYHKTEGRNDPSGRKQRADEFLTYRDNFYYHTPQLSELPNRDAIFSRFFANFEVVRPPPLPGDLIRISLQIAKSVNIWDEKHKADLHKMHRGQAKLLEHLIANKDELRLVLKHLNFEGRGLYDEMALPRIQSSRPGRRVSKALNGSRSNKPPRARTSVSI